MSDATDPRAVRVGVAPSTRNEGDPVMTVAPVAEPVLRPSVGVAGRAILGGVAGGGSGPMPAAGRGDNGRSPAVESVDVRTGTILVDGEPQAASLQRQDAVHAILRDPGTERTSSDAQASGLDSGPAVTRVRFGQPSRRPADGAVVREVVVDGWRVEVELESERRASLRERARRGHEASGRTGPVEVRAIIPGRIVALSVGPGDAVTAGQQVLVLEAMKMQNELRAPREGSVERIAVAVGDNVEVGDLLLVIT